MRIWITWEIQRRNRTISKEVDAILYEISVKMNRILRYCVCILKTGLLLFLRKPSLVFAQSPSILLAAFTVNWGKLFKIPTIIDMHNAGLFPFEGKKKWANRLIKDTIRKANLIIVSNKNLSKYVEKEGGSVFVLPDPIPKFSIASRQDRLKGKYNILFVCSFAEDEPYLEVIKAGWKLDQSVFFYITGNSRGKEVEFREILPPNVVLTGFVPESDYLNLLCSVDVVLVLTTREDCLLCGAYEAVSAEKPLIVSDTVVLRNHFSKGTLYTKNFHGDIALKVMNAIQNQRPLMQEMKELKRERIDDWKEKKARLGEILRQLEV